jgi:hypothetical protein
MQPIRARLVDIVAPAQQGLSPLALTDDGANIVGVTCGCAIEHRAVGAISPLLAIQKTQAIRAQMRKDATRLPWLVS